MKPLFFFLLLALGACADSSRFAEHLALQTPTPPQIDGQTNEVCWQEGTWYPLDQLWLGKPYQKTDFEGRFKVVWTEEKLYLLAEIVDDTLCDSHAEGLDQYWEDDCLEIFVDENHSGGDHLANHNAFAYHIALDGKVVDISPDQKPAYYDHIEVKRTQEGKKSIWEVAITVYNDQYKDHLKASNEKVRLKKGKKMGFAVAYCDSDGAGRENFVGSVRIEGEDKNKGYLDASVFGTLTLGSSQ